MSQTVKLKNLLRQARVFNLEAEYFRSQAGENGVGKPESLTLMPLEVREVPAQALECAEVKANLHPRRGRPTLRVVER